MVGSPLAAFRGVMVTGDGTPEKGSDQWRRRRRLADVFGDDLPDTSSDEVDPSGQGHIGDAKSRERWLRDNRPPHHG
ncbi:hypothetical protein SAMN05445060_0695 [Williamsia sterculiae]|uniref:Uncharacterized protein n=1 Tax=Williamsia sterculiae TaxID=1344003 RepID=A0A1N7DK32_9NOCA|nr:hypothetical protein SAMN05445060_0695 [Williamsia sterculiae]